MKETTLDYVSDFAERRRIGIYSKIDIPAERVGLSPEREAAVEGRQFVPSKKAVPANLDAGVRSGEGDRDRDRQTANPDKLQQAEPQNKGQIPRRISVQILARISPAIAVPRSSGNDCSRPRSSGRPVSGPEHNARSRALSEA